ncbi:MAG: tetratricopeptide repeat-containing glycosyltransferase family protein [Paraburkholderia sp.]|uniref:tetratricopeptide repeat protein n=1 Tax=Paraburkholderia sp. TaxID=1926495 RepID=UPI003C5D17E2
MLSSSNDSAAVSISPLVTRADADFAALRHREAADGYRGILAVYPRDTHALHRMALNCVHVKEFAQARKYLELALESAPTRADLWEHAGLVAAASGELVRAEAFYHRALTLSGSTATLHRNLADCLQLWGRLADAKTEYKRAAAIEVDLHHAIREVARISTKLGEWDAAADYWRRAWALNPYAVQDGLDLVAALARVQRTVELDEAVTQIRIRHAADIDALEALCLALYQIDRFADMLTVARQGLNIDPQRGMLQLYAAHALSVCGSVEEAGVHMRDAARLMPDDLAIRSQLGCLELALGDFKVGWALHNAIYASPFGRATRFFPDFPVWDGEPVAGCRFLLVGEQGCGDEIQLIRFAEWLHKEGAIVDVLVCPSVGRIAASLTGVRSVFTALPQGPYEYCSHMMRMPEHMQLDLPMLPIVMPYVAAEPDMLDVWRIRIKTISPESNHKERKRIGVVWAGGAYSALDRFRSVTLDAFRPLFALPDITWFSVQKGDHERESEALANEFDIHTLGPAIDDFADTLAILETLDLVVTVDTSVAHLAGAAGRPVWVLVPAYFEWRWLVGRTDSPWYPSMRLFRQRELGKWEPVIEEVRAALQALHGADAGSHDGRLSSPTPPAT